MAGRNNRCLCLPKSYFNNKKIRTYITHGAPALPVKTLYVNSVKLRLVMGVYTFVLGGNYHYLQKPNNFGRVPFVSEKKKKKVFKSCRKRHKKRYEKIK